MTPFSQNIVLENCQKKVTLGMDYLMLECHSLNTVSLYTLDSSYVMSRILALSGIERNDARLMTYSSDLSVLMFTKAYPWPFG